MLRSFVRSLGVLGRKRDPDPKLERKYRLTLNMKKVRPGANEADVSNWLMTMGLSPTGNPSI